MIAAAYQFPQSGIPVGRIFRRAVLSKCMSLKEAAIWMGGPHYEATLSRGVNGLAPLDLHAVCLLPMPVLFKLLRLLIAAKLAQWETESQEKRA